MAARKIIIGDQEVEIPDFNFKIIPVLLVILVLWLFTGIYSVGPEEHLVNSRELHSLG